MPDNLPRNALRLFAHYEGAEQLPAVSAELVIARLLEEGDGSDLRWLTRTYPEARLSTWLDEHGDRALSRRSRSFWRVVLDLSLPSTAAPGELLWPL